MGCDYYECLYLVIEWTTIDDPTNETHMHKELLSKSSRWFYGTCDSDSEGDYDRQLDEEMSKTEKSYGKKTVYENDKWIITSKSSIDEYDKIAKKYVSAGGKIIRMYKYVSCEERN